jgi:hypothetical protein
VGNPCKISKKSIPTLDATKKTTPEKREKRIISTKADREEELAKFFAIRPEKNPTPALVMVLSQRSLTENRSWTNPRKNPRTKPRTCPVKNPTKQAATRQRSGRIPNGLIEPNIVV